MSLLARVRQHMAIEQRGAPPAAKAGVNPMALTADEDRWSVPDYSLARNQQTLYPKLSWVYSAVTHVSQACALVPFRVQSRTGEDTQDIENHPFERLLERPNPLQSRFELLEATFGYQRLTGNAYWWLNRSAENAEPAEIWVIPAHRMKVVPDGTMGVRGYLYDDGSGVEYPLDAWEVVHFKQFNPMNPYVGLSPVESIAMQAVGEMATVNYNTGFFDRDNAKMDGILAFADPISGGEWNRLKADLKNEYGGSVRRSLMTLRNVGSGVEFIATGLSRKDMQFIEGRSFTKEEIYEVFAPGLSSMLSVNATEANSRTGKATFMEFAVWPALVRVAEVITNSLLPAYGDNLRGEFDDVRLSDRSMELQEMTAAYKVKTVDEVRAEYFGMEPLGDERGDDLVEGKSANAPTPPGFPPPNNPAPRFLETGGAQGDDEQTDGTKSVIEGRAVRMPTQPSLAQRVRDEVETWQRFVERRIKAGKTLDDMREFETDYIQPALKGAIEGALDGVTDVDEVRSIFEGAMLWRDYP